MFSWFMEPMIIDRILKVSNIFMLVLFINIHIGITFWIVSSNIRDFILIIFDKIGSHK